MDETEQLNVIFWYFLTGVLPDIQKWFGGIGQKKAGLLQTVFVVAYMVFAPVFGYLGDRFPRKYVMAVGITIWSATTFACSLMGRTVWLDYITYVIQFWVE